MSMSDIHIEMQDEILLMAEELGGEFTVEDAEQHLAENFPDFFGGPNSYTLTQEFLAEMVEAGLLMRRNNFFQLPYLFLMQNKILLMAEELGGEFTVEDAEAHLAENFPDFFGGPNSYTLTKKFLAEMVEARLLTGGYEDFFQLPDPEVDDQLPG